MDAPDPPMRHFREAKISHSKSRQRLRKSSSKRKVTRKLKTKKKRRYLIVGHLLTCLNKVKTSALTHTPLFYTKHYFWLTPNEQTVLTATHATLEGNTHYTDLATFSKAFTGRQRMLKWDRAEKITQHTHAS